MKRLMLLSAALLCLGAGNTANLRDHAATGIQISGGTFSAGMLRDGEPAFLSHPYVWESIPESLAGWSVTRVDAKICRDVEWRVAVKQPGYVYIAVLAAHASAFDKVAGWTATGTEFGFSDKLHCRMQVWRKEVRRSIRLPHAQLAILIPPE